MLYGLEISPKLRLRSPKLPHSSYQPSLAYKRGNCRICCHFKINFILFEVQCRSSRITIFFLIAVFPNNIPFWQFMSVMPLGLVLIVISRDARDTYFRNIWPVGYSANPKSDTGYPAGYPLRPDTVYLAGFSA
jgi:hypothetical protein